MNKNRLKIAFLSLAVMFGTFGVNLAFSSYSSVSAVTSTSNQTDTNSDAESSGDNCPLAASADLRWLGCPLIRIGVSATEGLQSLIKSFLYTPVKQIFDNKGFAQIAVTFRNIGIGLIVIAGLVMIVSQASGMEFMDAYTVRKLLPRMVVALVGMVLAWPLLEWIVTFFNDLGLWASYLISAATGTPSLADNATFDSGVGILTNVATAGTAAVGAAALGITLGFGGIISLLGTIFLALLIGFLVLGIRQVVILVCIIMAPLAIAAYVLPGTQKFWEFWKSALTTALMMFPIITAFLAAGAALSNIISQETDNKTTTLMALIVFYAPFFLLPFAFKLAGGLMATVFSIANDRGRGGFDRLKNYRQNKIHSNFEAMRNGNRFKSENRAARAFNRTTEGIASVQYAGMNPRRMRSRMQAGMSQHSMAEAAEFAEKDQNFRVIGQNDDFLMAAIKGGGNDSRVREILKSKEGGGYSGPALEQGVAAIRAARRATSADVFDTAAAMALPATGTAFKGGAGEMHDMINEVAGDDRVKAGRMLAAMRSGAASARRFDLAGGGFGDQIGVLEKQYQHKISTQEANDHIFRSSLEGQGGSYVVGGRKSTVENFAPIMLDKLRETQNSIPFKDASGTSDPGQVERRTMQELATLAGRYDAMSQIAPENARVMADKVMSQKVTLLGQTKTVQEHIEDRRGDEGFLQMRREYGASAARGGQQAAFIAAQAQAAQQQQGPNQPPIPPVMPPPGG